MEKSRAGGWKLRSQAAAVLRVIAAMPRLNRQRPHTKLRRSAKINSHALSTAAPAPRFVQFFHAITAPLHALYLYGAAAIGALGWAMCQYAGWDAHPWLPLWIASALFIFNIDRLRRDRADNANLPQRVRSMRRLRLWSLCLVAESAAVLTLLPIWRSDWRTLALVTGGALVSLGYSLPIFGFRFKDVPVLKTFFAPTIVAFSIFTLPWLDARPAPEQLPRLLLIVGYAWLLLMFNMITCDLRDLPGDATSGIHSLPAVLGERRTRRLLWMMLTAAEALALRLASDRAALHFIAWRIACLLTPLALGSLLLALRKSQPERFYEWWVEGIFFLPAMALCGEALLL